MEFKHIHPKEEKKRKKYRIGTTKKKHIGRDRVKTQIHKIHPTVVYWEQKISSYKDNFRLPFSKSNYLLNTKKKSNHNTKWLFLDCLQYFVLFTYKSKHVCICHAPIFAEYVFVCVCVCVS